MPKLVHSSQLTVHRILKTVNRELMTVNWRQRRHGFTLIEFLVVLGILALTVSSTLLFLTSVLRGSNKANVIAEVKQNGQAVLESLERQIRNGVDAEQVGPEGNNTIQIVRQDQGLLYLKCFPKGVSSNGYIGVSDQDASYVAMTNKDDIISGVHIDCTVPDCNGLKVTAASSGAVSPPIVSICFYASQGIDAPSRQDFEVTDPTNPNSKGIKFQTTIS